MADVERWKEDREQLTPFGKKPVLFVMIPDIEARIALLTGFGNRKSLSQQAGGDQAGG